MKNKTVLAIGRWMPIHLGHKQFLIKLAKAYDTLVVGIGSCYENGTPRNCIPALEREKLLHTIFKNEGISNYIIIHVPDRPTFDEWFSDIITICNKYNVTHFCTGNKEDILDVMSEKNLELNAEMINPEDSSDFPYHATDIRNAILNNEFSRLDNMIPSEIKEIVLSQVAKEIRLAKEGKGQEFIPGRQTVDLIFIVNDKNKNNRYLLIGKRDDTKTDFAGYYAIPGGGICEFESPTDAAIRCFAAETGIKIAINDNCPEPAKITIDNIENMQTDLYFTGIYASHDERVNGTLGGGSQCFAISIDGDIEKICNILHSTHDMVELKFVPLNDIYKIDFAYDQKRMVYNALIKLAIPFDKGELLQCFNEDGTPSDEPSSRLSAHKKGILHGASHTYIYKKENGNLYVLLQRRSNNKDSFPGCLDTSSAGHIEFGSDFLETAQKEIFEELGLRIDVNALEELFEQKIYRANKFHDEDFIDNEINKVYAIEMDCDTNTLKLQPEEVSEAKWFDVEIINKMISNNDPELCIDHNEITKVLDILTQR